jgi:DNA repair exonuclease SbcCD ATPase subunit
MLIHAVTKKPVPVTCQSAGTCVKHRCVLRYARHIEKCDGYRRREIKLKLQKLRLTNFKSFRNFELNPNGKNVSIFGDNELGKTTLFDAFMWLLFDKDSLNRSTFGLKTLENGEPIKGLDHEVEGVFDVDGSELSLKKIYREVYTRKRGSATEEFTGHTTDYFINEVPSKKSEFDSKIKSIAPEALFRLLTNPLHFNEQLHWQERRKILFEMCGDVTNEEIFESNKNLQELADILKSRSVDEHKKVLAAKRKEINEQLTKIPVRIDEAEKGKPETNSSNFEEIEKSIKEISTKENELREKLQLVKSGGGITEKQKEIAEIETQIIKSRNEAQNKANEEISKLQLKLTTAKSTLRDCLSIKDSTTKAIESKKKTITYQEQKIQGLRSKYTEISKTVFENNCTCPTCGQQLSEEKIEEAKANFNRDRSEKLQAINDEGKSLKIELEAEKKEISELETKLADYTQQEIETGENIKEIEKEIENVKPIVLDDFNLVTKKEDLLREIEEIKSGSAADVEKIEKELTALGNAKSLLQKEFAKKEQLENAEKRIKELRQQQKELAKEFEKYESQLFLVEEFTKAKIELLDEKINSHFVNARFRLFEEQINGGMNECCTVTYKGVPYTDLNNAGRINIGLEIISVLSAHYGFYAPIFVDNAESVTKLFDADSQVIRLVVSELDKKLRVEIEEE